MSPQFVWFTERVASVLRWIGLSIGLGLVAIAIWGFWACRSIARSYALPGPGPGAGVNPVVAAMSWLVLFLPLALLGACLARSVLRQMLTAAAERRIRVMAGARVVILTPPATHVPLAENVPPPVPREPLDEAETRRLDELGERAARFFNVALGLVFLALGLFGFLVMWMDSRQPGIGGLRSFRSQTYLLVGCGVFTLVGAMILLRSSRKPDTAWLAPLQAFARIIGIRAAAEAAARRNTPRRNKNRWRPGPG